MPQEIRQAIQQINVASKGGLVNQTIRTKLPGWRKNRDLAEAALTGWCETMSLPTSYAQKMLAYFDAAPERFVDAWPELSGDRTKIIVTCKIEVRRKEHEQIVKEFLISDLAKA